MVILADMPDIAHDPDESIAAPTTATAATLAGRRAWPDLRVSAADFEARWEACRASLGEPPLHPADLYLAHACLARDAAAMRAFESSYIACVGAYVARLRLSPSDLAEVQQVLRVKLLTGDDPKLAKYNGAGPLANWMKVTANRFALNLLADPTARREADIDASDVLVLASTDLPDSEQQLVNALMSHEHRVMLREVISEAFASLDDRQKTLLRMYLLDGVSVDAIARVFSVHRASIARWLSEIRKLVLDAVNARLSLHLGASPSQVRSLFRELRFDLNLSMARVLGVAPPKRE